jgi:2-succinyl-5-enolpyruvyl-6-hydroxy-3-cyclohexene-1-carboxylate synthase
VCIAPGSRSTPLTLAAAENRAFIHHTHFDERGLGHLALGLAKASKEPVAVIVTSGTAVANLYPALIEAGLTGEKLILLTADRPLSLSTAAPIRPFASRALFFASFADDFAAASHAGYSGKLAGLDRRSRHGDAAQRGAAYQLPVCRAAVWRAGRHRLDWQQRSATGGREKPWLREQTHLEARSSATGSSGGKSAAWLLPGA